MLYNEKYINIYIYICVCVLYIEICAITCSIRDSPVSPTFLCARLCKQQKISMGSRSLSRVPRRLGCNPTENILKQVCSQHRTKSTHGMNIVTETTNLESVFTSSACV